VKKPRKRNPVPPSSRAKLATQYGEEFRQAAALFADFSGHDAQPWKKVSVKLPRVMLVAGRCDGLLYTTVRDGETEKYIHRFKAADAPALCVSPNGNMLFLIGGNFTFTERGITDDSSSE